MGTGVAKSGLYDEFYRTMISGFQFASPDKAAPWDFNGNAGLVDDALKDAAFRVANPGDWTTFAWLRLGNILPVPLDPSIR